MTVRISPSRVIAWVVLSTLAVSACGSELRKSRDGLEGAPGAFTFSGGSTAHADMFHQAAQLLSEGDHAGAESIYRRLVDLEPADPAGFIGLGSSLFFQDRLDEAAGAYTHAIELDEDSSEAHIGLGSVALKAGDVDAALDEYSKALDLNEESAEAHWGMALALQAHGEPAGAISHLERLVELAPDTALAALAQSRLDVLQSPAEP